ncbi:MAG: hypothetical protein ACLUOI_38195 [Eisenbergiella sp.]
MAKAGTGYSSMDGTDWSNRKGIPAPAIFQALAAPGSPAMIFWRHGGGRVDGRLMEIPVPVVRLLTGILGLKDPGPWYMRRRGPEGEHTLTITVKGERAPVHGRAALLIISLFSEGDYGDTQLLLTVNSTILSFPGAAIPNRPSGFHQAIHDGFIRGWEEKRTADTDIDVEQKKES